MFDSRREFHSLRKMLLLTWIRAKKLLFAWLWVKSCRVSVEKTSTKSSSACSSATVAIGLGYFGWKWQMVPSGSSLRYKSSGVAALSVDPLGASQSGYPLCKPSNVREQLKLKKQFLPTKACKFWSVVLAGHVLLECQFVEIEMFSGGISISWMFQLKPSSICFETCQPGLFLPIGCPLLARPWGACHFETWPVCGELKIWVSCIQGPWLLIFDFR